METTYERNVVAEERSKLHSKIHHLSLSLRGTGPRLTLATLVDAWESALEHVPIAIVVSIYDDLLARAADAEGGDPDRSDELSFHSVVVDESGVARTKETPRV